MAGSEFHVRRQHAHGQTSADGFTLIELLVSISIIALLIALLLPALKQAHYQAQLAQCASQVRQMGIAAVAYGVDNRDYFPSRLWHTDFLNGGYVTAEQPM